MLLHFCSFNADIPTKAVPEDIQRNLINAILTAHDGVLRYTPSMPDLVETSCNLAIVNIADGKAEVITMARSSLDSMKQYLCNQYIACFSMVGMEVTFDGSYSGWQPNPKSALVAHDSAPRKRVVVPHFGSGPGAARGFSLSQIPQTREGWPSPLSGSPGLQQASLDLQLITGRPTLVK